MVGEGEEDEDERRVDEENESDDLGNNREHGSGEPEAEFRLGSRLKATAGQRRGMAAARIAVVGSGAAGLACAQRLLSAGFHVTLLDKGTRPGGRLGTRRGAAASRPATPAERSRVPTADWPELDEDTSVVYGAQYAHGVAPTGSPLDADAGQWRVADAGRGPEKARTGLLATLMGDIATASQGPRGSFVHFQSAHVTGIAPGSRAVDVQGGDATFGAFDAVAVTAPAPQTALLLDGIVPPAEVKAVYRACLTAVATVPASHSASLGALAAGELVAHVERTDLASGDVCLVMHAHETTAQALLEESKDRIGQLLTADVLGGALAKEATLVRGHRWRFCRVSEAVGTPHWLSESGQIGVAGDWRLGANVGDALASGASLGDALVARWK